MACNKTCDLVDAQVSLSLDKCVVCYESGDIVALGARGIETLIQCSQARGNEVLTEYLLANPEKVMIHAAC